MAPKMNLRISLRSTEDKNKMSFQDVRNNLVFGLADGLTSSGHLYILSKINHNFRKYCEVLTVRFQIVPI